MIANGPPLSFASAGSSGFVHYRTTLPHGVRAQRRNETALTTFKER